MRTRGVPRPREPGLGLDEAVEFVHDLGQALESVRLRVDLAQRRLAQGDDDSVRRHLQGIRSSAQRLQDDMSTFLDQARTAAGELHVETAPCDLRQLVLDCVLEADPDGLRVSAAVSDEPLRMTLDRPRMRRVILNLLRNAIKYSAGAVEVQLAEREEEALLLVRDHGAGMDAADLDRAFDRFYRSPRTAALAPGSGLGLYVCRRIVEAHGGQLLAESAGPQEGSTFTVVLPVAEKLTKTDA